MSVKEKEQEVTTDLDLSADQLREMLYKMYLIRAFEEAAFEQFSVGKVHGTMHLAIGQEATGVGSITALRPDDQIASTHRGHAHAIAKGQDVRDMMAELLGKATGVCLGQGGSMHMADLNLGSLGANGIVAGGIPLAVGAGLSAHLQKNDKVVLSFFGDGASNNANFHESLNMAAIWKLPVVFICENNQYAMSMPAVKGVSAPLISNRAVAYDIPGETIDGMDVLAVYEATQKAVARARRGEGPTLLEFITYRYKGHSKSDKQLYRTKEEVKEWEERDAIPRFQNWLVEQEIITAVEGQAMQAQAEAEVDAAVDYADEQPDPSPADMYKTVYYEEPELKANPTKVLPAWIKNTFGPNTPINPDPGSREITYAEALREAMDLALGHDEKVFMLGEDIGLYGGAFGVTTGLFEKYGGARVRDTPISENCIAGTAIGAGMTGMRAIGEMQFMDFVTLAMEQIVLQGAKIRFMFGGKAHVSMVLRLPAGSGTGAAAQHSQTLESWFVNVPGLKVVMPSTPYDAKGMLLAAIADNNPIMFVENKLLYKRAGPVPEGPYIVPLGQADIKRPGKDLTIVATSIMISRALEAAGQLAQEGIEAEIVDPRTLKPYEAAPIINSVKKTGRLLVVHEAPLLGGYGGEIAGHISGGTGPTVGLRADMDALLIQEANGTDYDSEIPGVMHACGHDAHTAILMGAATILKDLADEGRLPGNVRLLFQPSEEAQDDEGKSGSPRMIEAGALANLDAVFGLHIDPRKVTGTVGLQAGPIAAAADMFDLTIHGFGGHGAFPHTANDPITLATYVVQAVNQIVGRRIDPFQPGVVSICTFHAGAGTARNTIPQTVELSGTIRSMTPKIRQQLHDELRRACAIVEPLGGRFDLKIQWGYPPTVNDPAATGLAFSALNELLGESKVIEVEPFMAAEDFSFMLQEVPGCFLLVGVKHPSWEREMPPHTPIFKIDEDVLPIGAASLVALALKWMQENRRYTKRTLKFPVCPNRQQG